MVSFFYQFDVALIKKRFFIFNFIFLEEIFLVNRLFAFVKFTFERFGFVFKKDDVLIKYLFSSVKIEVNLGFIHLIKLNSGSSLFNFPFE